MGGRSRSKVVRADGLEKGRGVGTSCRRQLANVIPSQSLLRVALYSSRRSVLSLVARKCPRGLQRMTLCDQSTSLPDVVLLHKNITFTRTEHSFSMRAAQQDAGESIVFQLSSSRCSEKLFAERVPLTHKSSVHPLFCTVPSRHSV